MCYFMLFPTPSARSTGTLPVNRRPRIDKYVQSSRAVTKGKNPRTGLPFFIFLVLQVSFASPSSTCIVFAVPLNWNAQSQWRQLVLNARTVYIQRTSVNTKGTARVAVNSPVGILVSPRTGVLVATSNRYGSTFNARRRLQYHATKIMPGMKATGMQ